MDGKSLPLTEKLGFAGRVLLHTLSAVIGTAILERPFYNLLHVAGSVGIVSSVILSSLIVAGLIGALAGRVSPKGSQWAWILPTSFFAIGLVAFPLAMMTGAACIPGANPDICRPFLIFTVPFVRAVAYSVAARVTMTLWKQKPTPLSAV